MFVKLFKKFWNYFDLDKRYRNSYGLPEVKKFPMPPVKPPREEDEVIELTEIVNVQNKLSSRLNKPKRKRTLSSQLPEDKRQYIPLVKKEK